MGYQKENVQTNHFKMMKVRGWDYTFWAIDIHGTMIKPDYSATNGEIPMEFYPDAKEVLQMISNRSDIKMILYTCSYPEEQKKYLKYFEENGINFDFLNKNPEVKTGQDSHGYYEDKPYMNILLDDKAGFKPEGKNNDWLDIKEILEANPLS